MANGLIVLISRDTGVLSVNHEDNECFHAYEHKFPYIHKALKRKRKVLQMLNNFEESNNNKSVNTTLVIARRLKKLKEKVVNVTYYKGRRHIAPQTVMDDPMEHINDSPAPGDGLPGDVITAYCWAGGAYTCKPLWGARYARSYISKDEKDGKKKKVILNERRTKTRKIINIAISE